MKTKLTRMFIITLLAIGIAISAVAQPKPLTNQDVIKMIEERLPESVIISKIQTSATKFDTSTDAIIELNKKGVSEKILNAMLNPNEAVQAPAPAIAGGGSVGLTGRAVGPTVLLSSVLLLGGAEPIEMKQNKGEFDFFAAPFFAKSFIKFEGRKAEFRLTNGSPVFEMTLPGNWIAAEHINLVKPSVEKTRREVTVQGMAGPGVPIRPDKKAKVALAFEEVRKENTAGGQFAVLRAKPVSALRPGEYVLSIDQAFFCFGVDNTK